jgi:hypothetical protein
MSPGGWHVFSLPKVFMRAGISSPDLMAQSRDCLHGVSLEQIATQSGIYAIFLRAFISVRSMAPQQLPVPGRRDITARGDLGPRYHYADHGKTVYAVCRLSVGLERCPMFSASMRSSLAVAPGRRSRGHPGLCAGPAPQVIFTAARQSLAWHAVPLLLAGAVGSLNLGADRAGFRGWAPPSSTWNRSSEIMPQTVRML